MTNGPVPGPEELAGGRLDAPTERDVEDELQNDELRRTERSNRFRRHQFLWDVWWYGLAVLLSIPFVLVGALILAVLYYGIPFAAGKVFGISTAGDTVDLLVWRVGAVGAFVTVAALFARSRPGRGNGR